MKTIIRLALAAAVTATLTGVGAAGADAAPAQHHRSSPAGTVFVQNDAVDGNQIVGYDRLADGTLRRAGTYATGGRGLVLDGSVVDHLASQSSLVRSGASLFAVNAGSNTITSFHVSGDRLSRRQVLASGGTAPVSIAAHGDLVYVLNARDGGSIQGYLNLGGTLIAVPGWHRDLGLDPNAAPEFTHTPAQIAFTPDGSKLVVSTKGNTSAFMVFHLGWLGAPGKPVVNTLRATCRSVSVRSVATPGRQRGRAERGRQFHRARGRIRDQGCRADDRAASHLLDRRRRPVCLCVECW